MNNKKIDLGDGLFINISQGNSKMGRVFSFSMPAVVTCASGIPCAKTCYACKFYNNVKNCYRQNMQALDNVNVDRLADAIANYLNSKDVRLFRWNVSGDFARNGKFDHVYWSLACKVAKKCPGTLFLAFTKVFDCFKYKRPANFNLVASVWNDYRPKTISNKPTAHFCDGTREMPKHAVKCSGECETCMLCFGLRKGEAVYFEKH